MYKNNGIVINATDEAKRKPAKKAAHVICPDCAVPAKPMKEEKKDENYRS
jgi:hypothetical protein